MTNTDVPDTEHTFREVAWVPVTELARFPGNANRGDVAGIRASLRRTGQYRALIVRRDPDDGTLTVLAGNNTLDALRAEGVQRARVEIHECDDHTATRINVADNKIARAAVIDEDALLDQLDFLEGDYVGTGYTQGEINYLLGEGGIMDDLEHEISGVGAAGLLDDDPENEHEPDGDPDEEPDEEADEDEDDPAVLPAEIRHVGNPGALAGRFLVPPFTSVDARRGWWRERRRQWDSVLPSGPRTHLDPVIAEIALRWWSPPEGAVLDATADGPTVALVADYLGRSIADPDSIAPVDMIIGYPDDPAGQADTIATACGRLRDDSYAVWIPTDQRDDDGYLTGATADATHAFQRAGLHLVTEATVHIPLIGQLMRAARMFSATRTLAATHRTVLVFCKGDKAAATSRCGAVEVAGALDSLDALADLDSDADAS